MVPTQLNMRIDSGMMLTLVIMVFPKVQGGKVSGICSYLIKSKCLCGVFVEMSFLKVSVL